LDGGDYNAFLSTFSVEEMIRTTRNAAYENLVYLPDKHHRHRVHNNQLSACKFFHGKGFGPQ
jgi:hypothetical protein